MVMLILLKNYYPFKIFKSTVKTFNYRVSDDIKVFFFYYIKIYNHLWSLIQISNNTPLIWAAWEGHTNVVRELLLHKNIDINAQNI